MKKLFTSIVIILSMILISADNCEAKRPSWGKYIKQANKCLHGDDYDCAISNFHKALKRMGHGDRRPEMQCYYGLGKAYKAQARYDLAEENFIKSLTLAERTNDSNMSGRLLMHLAEIYGKWGDHKTVLKYLKKAAVKLENSSDAKVLAVLNTSTAMSYKKTRQFDLAEKHLLKALDYAGKGTSIKQKALVWSKLGEIYLRNRKPDQALEAFTKALEINEKLGKESIVATELNDIAKIHIGSKNLKEAELLLLQALQINQRLGRDKNIADDLHLLGVVAYDRGDTSSAIKYLSQAVKIKNKLRETAKGSARRTYLSSQINSYNRLIDVYSAAKNPDGFFTTFEMSRARQLAETIGRDAPDNKLTLKGMQSIIPEKTAVLMYSVTGKNRLRLLAFTSASSIVKRLKFNEFTAAVNNSQTIMTAELSKTDLPERGFRSTAKKELKKLPPIQDIREAITRYRTFLADPVDTYIQDRLSLSRELYRMLISSAADLLRGKQHLLIIPDGPLALIPFETLITDTNCFLVEEYGISYIQSAGIYDLLISRKNKAEELSISAFGGAEYQGSYQRPDLPKGTCEDAALEEAIDRALNEKTSLSFAYACLDYDSFADLPGTTAELERIGSIFKKHRLVTGRDVNEKAIRTMADQGVFKQFSILHFAVHGLALPTFPELSALVLSRNAEEGSQEGYLNAAEIQSLDIGARFVNLSACETGLGALVRGEGVVGLTHAFLSAGAGGISVSLWNVADDSAVDFMEDMYTGVVGGENFDTAMSATKRNFINGKFGERFKKPYYWAPFVYYGK